MKNLHEEKEYVKDTPISKITPLLSPYLNGGRKCEEWCIEEISHRGNYLKSRVKMTNYFVSPTDTGFHLSNITGLEIVAQLRIIHIHLFLGLDKKSKEIWFVKGSEKCIRPIRDPNQILVEMTSDFVQQGEKHLVKMKATVSDPLGGRFDYTATVLI